jgi:putative membrane protein
MTLSTHALYELGRYIASARKAGMLNDAGPAGTSFANSIVHSLGVARASLDRIACTAIPLVYGIHLKQCTLLYLLALPLTLVSELGWKSVPFTGLVAITLLGLEGISSEVEMPFGDDQSDHNLALWCAQFRMEIEGMLAELDEGADVGLCL